MSYQIEPLAIMAKECRKDIIEMIYSAKSGHPGGSLSAIDVLVGLYQTALNYRLEDMNWRDRDRFIMSKGHASPAIYSILHQLDIISKEDILSFRRLGSVCQGHVDMKWTYGVDFSAGSLGMGLSFGLGCALAAKMDKSKRKIWVMIGDGETQEGQIWEAAMAASYHSTENLNIIVDRNRIQNDDFVGNQMEIGNIGKKFESFGWNIREIDGHNMEEIVDALDWAKNDNSGPSAIIAQTIKGKGVSFMENSVLWHYRSPQGEEFTEAMKELEEEK